MGSAELSSGARPERGWAEGLCVPAGCAPQAWNPQSAAGQPWRGAQERRAWLPLRGEPCWTSLTRLHAVGAPCPPPCGVWGCPPALLRHVDLPVGSGRRAQTLGALPSAALALALGAANLAVSRVSQGSQTPGTSGRSALLLGDCLLGGFCLSGLARGCHGERGPQACRMLVALSSGAGVGLTSCHRRSSRARPGVPSTAARAQGAPGGPWRGLSPGGPRPGAGPGRWLSTPGTGRLGGQVLRDLVTLDTLGVVTVTSLV